MKNLGAYMQLHEDGESGFEGFVWEIKRETPVCSKILCGVLLESRG